MRLPLDRKWPPAAVWWPLIAGVFVLAFTVATPPFQGPDEVGHFWRAYSLARGSVLPKIEHGKPTVYLPRGVRDLVGTLWVETAGKSGSDAKVGLDRIRAAAQLPLSRSELVPVTIPAHYTPIPYFSQTLACLIGDNLRLRPLATFYLGRLFNGAFALLLITIGLRLARDPWPFASIAMLPMLLYLCGTYSPDATTAGLAFLVVALALRFDADQQTQDSWWSFVGCSFLLALCKPAYFLVPFIVVGRLKERRIVRIALLAAAVGVGVWISSATAHRNFYAMRTDVPIGIAEQALNVRLAPFHFISIAAHDYRAHWYAYLDHFVGHLGWLDIQLPHQLIVCVLGLLLLIGLTTRRLPFRDRLVAVAIVVCSLTLISLSQYLAWTPIGGETIEGMQGRYLLPLGPLGILLLGITDRWPRATTAIRAAFLLVSVMLNIVAVTLVIQRYY